jgi:NarL family two-component system response regulator YdfI
VRVVLVGGPDGRARLRRSLTGTSIAVVGEARSVAEARAARLETDAFLVAADGADPHGVPAVMEPLTPRELEVLDLVAEGLSNKRIAARLAISDQTVKFHVASICGKLGAANRTDALRRALRRGLVTL